MTVRTSLFLAPVALVASTMTGAATSPVAPSAEEGGTPRGPSAVLEQIGFDQRLGDRLPPDARFRDQDGRTVRFGDLYGERATVLVFVYYECPMLCTLVLNGLLRSLKAIELEAGSDFAVVAIGIDPDEAPELAAAKRANCLEEYGHAGVEHGWHFLTGDETEIRRVADAAGFRYAYVEEADEYAHASGLLVLTEDGTIARVLYGVEFPPRDLRLGIVEASAGRIGSAIDQVLLLCYHYDPLTGRYGFAIMNVIRLLGGLTVLILAGFVVRSLRRERRARAALQGAQS